MTINKIPNIGKNIGAPDDDAIIVQNIPNTTHIIEPKVPMADGPRPGFILFILYKPPVIKILFMNRLLFILGLFNIELADNTLFLRDIYYRKSHQPIILKH